jgi:hypothetical protein
MDCRILPEHNVDEVIETASRNRIKSGWLKRNSISKWKANTGMTHPAADTG